MKVRGTGGQEDKINRMMGKGESGKRGVMSVGAIRTVETMGYFRASVRDYGRVDSEIGAPSTVRLS